MKNLVFLIFTVFTLVSYSQIDSNATAILKANDYVKEKIGENLFSKLLGEPAIEARIDYWTDSTLHFYLKYPISLYKTGDEISLVLNSKFEVDSNFSNIKHLDSSNFQNYNLPKYSKFKRVCRRHFLRPSVASVYIRESGVVVYYNRRYIYNASCHIQHSIDLATREKIYRGRICLTF